MCGSKILHADPFILGQNMGLIRCWQEMLSWRRIFFKI